MVRTIINTLPLVIAVASMCCTAAVLISIKQAEISAAAYPAKCLCNRSKVAT